MRPIKLDKADSRPKSFSIIGTGRVGSHLATALVRAGFIPGLLVSKRGESSERLSIILAAETEAAVRSAALESAAQIPGDVIFVSVLDDALPGIVQTLSKPGVLSSNQVIFHTSGGLTASILSPLAEDGRSVASFHPLQTFVLQDAVPADPEIFRDLPVAIEGDERAVDSGFFLAEALGSKPFLLNGEAKLLYHAAAVISSNFVTTILGSAQALLNEISDSSELSIELFKPLVEQAVRNSFDRGPDHALTGPVARGDLQLLVSHLTAIAEQSPESLPLYVELSRETVRLSRKTGRLSKETATAIDDILDSHVGVSGQP